MPTAREERKYPRNGCADCTSFNFRYIAVPLAIAGWLITTIPSTAATIPSSYRNQFRSCAGRLVNAGISVDEAATVCAQSLRPVELSLCVAQIDQRTEIEAGEALNTCRQVRRPEELATCVVGIINNNQQEPVPGVLNYCGRSLLPEEFARCVVGLRREIDFAPTRAMETCIDTTDRVTSDFLPTFVPGNQAPTQPAPLTPDVSGDSTPLAEPSVPPTSAPRSPGGV